MLNSIPFLWEQTSLNQLPDDGWDAVLRKGAEAKGKRQANMLSALSVTVDPEFR
ncbi:hypothetical protein HGO23_19425 [Xenorhabdus budapestensis]|uniref:Transposase n=1 Tax=Xenorhabdus budapestensis TaxID=290110 RepID=A0ABX7VIW6_XENBU|nr:hypothetical protein [Xenorhabdus budapestensis]QTL39871.1 hypothetical protein HGO23_19425 [Xenorhabdus budapestensis]